jgi:hypothetical protein
MFGFSPFSEVPFSAVGKSDNVFAGVVGVSASGAVGSVVAPAAVVLVGVSATAQVGIVTVQTNVVVLVFGVFATGGAGQVRVWGQIVPNPGTAWTEVDPGAINP